MIIGAFWYLDKWAHSGFGDFAWSMAKTDDGENMMMPGALVFSLATAGVPALAIAAMPYQTISVASSKLDEYVYRTSTTGKMSSFSFTKRRFVYSNRWLLRSAAKIGARAVPGLGWALLAYDLYTVADWYMRSDDPLGIR